jgi:hypothetical protein
MTYVARKFTPSSSDSMAMGNVLMPYHGVLQGSSLEHLIEKYALDKLVADEFYPQQTVCDMQSEIVEKEGLFSGALVAIGKDSIASIGFPPEIQTVEGALSMLHNIYQQIHKNIPEEEGWRFEQVDETTQKIYFNSPYERFAAYGYIWGIAQRFKPEDMDFSVYMEEEGGMTVYRVKLRPAEDS